MTSSQLEPTHVICYSIHPTHNTMTTSKTIKNVIELSKLNARIRRTCIRITRIEETKNWTNNERLCDQHADLSVLLTQLCDKWKELTKAD